MVKKNSKNLSIGQYLLDRLKELGVQHIFGVPGDYVLRLDKLIEEDQDIEFINTTRENTAGYAADAYARMRGLGAACITYGVGINIVNALAQAFVESSPLVVISGTAGTDEYLRNPALHHLINKSITTHSDTTQLEIFKHVTIDQGILDDPTTATQIIDRVLTACLQFKKPVYFEIPRNKIDQPVQAAETPFQFHYKPSNQENLKKAFNEIKHIFSTTHRPVIWAGHEILRYGLTKPLLAFAEKHQIPIVSSLLGKTVVDEHHPLFAGVYQGGMSSPEVINLINQCDCLILAGVLLNDLDTGIFTAKLDQKHHIRINPFTLHIGDQAYHQIALSDAMQEMGKLNLNKTFPITHIQKKSLLPARFKPIPGAKSTTKRIFECIQSHLTEEHILMTDVGDCLFASADLVLSQDSFIACAYFASLGFGTPGALGAQLARPNKRVIAIVGDGGFQMTAMELSLAVKNHLDIIMIVLNNHGYGTERPLLDGNYNDILDWNYTEIPRVLGGGRGIKAEDEETFEHALSEALNQREQFYLIEVPLDKLDFSPALHRLGDLLGNVVKAK